MLIIGGCWVFVKSDKPSFQGVEVIELSDTANAPHCQAHSKMNVDWKVLLYSFPMPASMIIGPFNWTPTAPVIQLWPGSCRTADTTYIWITGHSRTVGTSTFPCISIH